MSLWILLWITDKFFLVYMLNILFPELIKGSIEVENPYLKTKKSENKDFFLLKLRKKNTFVHSVCSMYKCII